MVQTPYSKNLLPSHESCIDLWNEFSHVFRVCVLPLHTLSNKRAFLEEVRGYVCAAFCDKMSSSFWQHWETHMEKDSTMDSSSESTPKRLQGQRRPATYWRCAGTASNADRGKLPIESPRVHERRWLVVFLRQYALQLMLCCIVAALLLAWYIPYLFPGWYSAAVSLLDAHRLFAIVLSIILVVFLLFWLLLWKLPQWQVAAVPEMKDRIDLETRSRQTMAQILGGAALLGGLCFTTQTLRLSQEDLQLTQEGQITERFTKAIDQLGKSGKENLAVRLGGIYALERIAKDSAKDHEQIIEVLTAFVREQTHVQKTIPDQLPPAAGESPEQGREKVSADVQAILTVLGRRTRTIGDGESQRLDLSKAQLQGANLQGAKFQGADLQGANLRGADLEGAKLQRADLQGANLRGANLEGANLLEANLRGADFREAYLWRKANLSKASLHNANLEGANLEGANLEGANLWGAKLQRAKLQGTKLQGADLMVAELQGANLEGANLRETDLRGAQLEGANLQGANLQGAKNCTQNQLTTACGDENTKLPANLESLIKFPLCFEEEG
jgi:uncharacterized protein YjbI with pentapeptide repeats